MASDNLGIIHETITVTAKVVKVGSYPWNDIICEDVRTGSRFVMDPKVGASGVPDLKVGDVFTATVHPVNVVFAILDWDGIQAQRGA